MMFIFNPISGKARVKSELFNIVDSFVKAGFDVRVHPTQEQNDAYEQIKNHGKKYDMIVASGGDGTLRESINGLMTIAEEKRPSFGYIPSGTVNDFATALRIPKTVKKAVKKIATGKSTAIDIGKGNDKYFSYVAGFGLFTEVSYETPQNAKNALGKAAYFFAGVKSLANIKPYKMTVKWDGGEESGEFILGLITNVDHVAGMKTKYNENSQINDGLFEVILVRKPKLLAQLSIMAAEMMSSKLSEEYFLKFSAKSVTFESDEKIKWTFDGEFGGEEERMEISVIERAIDIIL